MNLFFKGLIIGIGKILPGVSGSFLAVLFNVYDESIKRISNPFLNLKDNTIFFLKLGSGIIISIVFMSNIILLLINRYFLSTMSLIFGLIIGVLPKFFKEIKISKKLEFLYLAIPFVTMLLLKKVYIGGVFFKEINSFKIIIIGLIESLTTLIPGISGTAIYLTLGCYKYVLSLFSNPFCFEFFVFFIGVILGFLIVSNILKFILNRYKSKLQLIVFSLMIFSSVSILKELFNYMSIENLFVSFCLMFIGIKISKKLDI